MAAVPMTFVGMATGDDGRSGNVTLVGMASITGLSVGGGPLPGGPPPSIWPDPGHPHPEHPIAPGGNVPAHPIELPKPGHPLPEPPTEPPTNPPDPTWVWGYNPSHGWLPVHVPGPTDPQPH